MSKKIKLSQTRDETGALVEVELLAGDSEALGGTPANDIQDDIDSRVGIATDETISGAKLFTKLLTINNVNTSGIPSIITNGLIQTGSTTLTYYTGFVTTRLCANDSNNSNSASFFTNSDGTARFCHKRGDVTTKDDAYIVFDATKLIYGASGIKGNNTVVDYDILHSGNTQGNNVVLNWGTTNNLVKIDGTQYTISLPDKPADANDNQTIGVDSTTFGANALVKLIAGNHVTLTPDAILSTITMDSSWRPVINNLTSTDVESSLSANQGKVLNETKVPNTRTVNSKALSSDVTVYSNEIPISTTDSRSIETLLGDLYNVANGKVPTTRKVNGKALSGDITLDSSDVRATPLTTVKDNAINGVDIMTNGDSVRAVNKSQNAFVSFKGSDFIDSNDKYRLLLDKSPYTTSAQNCDTFTTSGVYIVDSGVLNKPDIKLNGNLFVMALDDSYVNQYFQTYCDENNQNRGGTAYVRSKVNGTWSGWKKLINSSDVSAPLAFNKIVKRDNNGYIYGVYYNSAIGNENGMTLNSVYCTSDNWIRKMSFSKFMEHIRGELNADNIVTGLDDSNPIRTYLAYANGLRASLIDQGSCKIYADNIKCGADDSNSIRAYLSGIFNGNNPVGKSVCDSNGLNISDGYLKKTDSKWKGCYIYTIPMKYDTDWLQNDPRISNACTGSSLNLGAICGEACVGNTIGGRTTSLPSGCDGWGTFWSLGKLQFYYAWNSNGSGHYIFTRAFKNSWRPWSALD